MNKNSERLLVIAIMAALAASMFLGGYETGKITGFQDGADAAFNESVKWCADAINRVCPDPDYGKLLPKQKPTKETKT